MPKALETKKPTKVKASSEKTKKPEPVKTPVEGVKPINVPVMRCVSQLKSLLNTSIKNSIDEFGEKNRNYVETESKFHARIKENRKNETERKKVQKEYDTWKNGDKVKNLTKEIRNLRKSVYRISGTASKYVAQIIEVIIRTTLAYGVKQISENASQSKQPKLLPKDFKEMTEENNSSFPLIMGLKSLDCIKNDKREEPVKEEPVKEEPVKEDKKKEPPTYKMVIYNIFKSLLDKEKTSKMCCSGPCKQFISDTIMEFVEKLHFYLTVLVGSASSTSTINEKHILNACKLMYYNAYRSVDQYDEFSKTIVDMYNTKCQKKSS